MKLKILALLTLGIFLAFTGCDNIVDERLNAAEDDRIDVEMSRLPAPSQPAAGATEMVVDATEKNTIDPTDEYVVKKWQYYEVPQMSSYMAEDLPDNLLWPGAILDSTAFVNGSYKEIASSKIKRAPLMITTDANVAGGTIYLETDTPNEVTVRQIVNNLITQQGTVNTTKYIRSNYETYTTSSELSTKLKTSLGYKGLVVEAKLDALLERGSSTKTSKIVLDFTQCYFTIRPALVTKASDFFDYQNTSWEDISEQLTGAGAKPVFVSSIDYGRSIMAVIESDESAESLNVSVSAYVSYLKNKGSVSVDIANEVNKLKSTATITALVVGGNGDYANMTSFDGIKTWLDDAGGISFSKPLRYTLRYLSDPTSAQPVGFVTGGVYYEKAPKAVVNEWEEFSPAVYNQSHCTYSGSSLGSEPLASDPGPGYMWNQGTITFVMSGGQRYRMSGKCSDNFTGCILNAEGRRVFAAKEEFTIESSSTEWIINIDSPSAAISNIKFERKIR